MHYIKFFLKPFSFMPAFFMMYVIFYLSSQEGISSSNLSYRVSHKIVSVANETFDLGLGSGQVEQHVNKIHHYVRKGAHMTEYFLLAVSLSFPLYVYGLRGIPLMIVAGGICVGFACLDEYHQSFVAGRGPSKKDVMIDSLGVFMGIILVRIVCFIGRMTIFRKRRRRRA